MKAKVMTSSDYSEPGEVKDNVLLKLTVMLVVRAIKPSPVERR